MNEKMRSTIYLIRHGLTEGNVKNWCYGGVDLPLLEEGVQGIVTLAHQGIYPAGDDANLYTSALQRTKQTFGLIYGDVPYTELAEFNEFNFGKFEKQAIAELERQAEFLAWSGDETGEICAPGGESFNAFKQRVLGGWNTLVNRHRVKELSHRHSKLPATSIVICHAGVIGAVMEAAFPETERKLFAWTPDPGRGYKIYLENGDVARFDSL